MMEMTKGQNAMKDIMSLEDRIMAYESGEAGKGGTMDEGLISTGLYVLSQMPAHQYTTWDDDPSNDLLLIGAILETIYDDSFSEELRRNISFGEYMFLLKEAIMCSDESGKLNVMKTMSATELYFFVKSLNYHLPDSSPLKSLYRANFGVLKKVCYKRLLSLLDEPSIEGLDKKITDFIYMEDDRTFEQVMKAGCQNKSKDDDPYKLKVFGDDNKKNYDILLFDVFMTLYAGTHKRVPLEKDAFAEYMHQKIASMNRLNIKLEEV